MTFVSNCEAIVCIMHFVSWVFQSRNCQYTDGLQSELMGVTFLCFGENVVQ